MTRLRVFTSRVLGLFTRRRRKAQLNDEIEAHLDLLSVEHRRRGMSIDDARVAARREFGGIEQIKETYRDQRRLPMFETFWQDLRYACRSFRRAPTFAITVVATIALGLGLNAAAFTVFNAYVLRSAAVLVACMAAAWYPALRASRVNAIVALRYE